jgi:lysophospholipase L1-like esterase
MPFGDSITEGYPNGGGYRIELFRLAHQANHAITFVGSLVNGPTMVDGVMFPRNHEGHGGYTIEGTNGIAQFVQSSMRNYTPHVITLMIGTNDINGNIDVANAPTRLGRLLDSIYAQNADVLVVLAQIVPTRTDGTNNAVRTYNAAIPALVSARTAMGRHLVLIDMYTAFTRDTNYKTALLGDNLHPNDAGYVRMGETWYQALSPYLR